MAIDIPQQKARFKWVSILTTAGMVFVSATLLIAYFPGHYELILFGLYSIPSHMLISPFPHEPYLFLIAKYYTPLTISLVAMLGCGIAGFLDYWLLMPLINHRSLRPKFENNSLYQKSLHIFKKSPFLLLSGAAMSPIPYYPFKFLSIAGNYPLWKYQTALLVGRMPRYFLLALLGKALQVPTWLLVVIFFVLLLLPFAQKFKLPGMKRRQRLRQKKQAERDLMMPEYEDLIPISEGPDSYHTVTHS